MTKRVPITVWLTPTELTTIDRIAQNEARSRSQTAVRMLNEALRFGIAYQTPERQAEMAMYDLASYDKRTPLEREADEQAAAARKAKASSDGPIPYPGDEVAERLPSGGWREREDNRPHGYRHMPVRNIPPADEYCDESLHADPAWHCSEPEHGDGWHIAVAGRTVVAVWPAT